MDKIKFRFLNYKKYSSFQTALRDGRILDDSIVFIQDKNCIWARGKEYVCDGPYTTDTGIDGTVTLKRGDGTVIFKIGQKDGIIDIIDGDGNINRAVYATKDYIDSSMLSKQDKLQAGSGISIEGTVISSTLSTDVYEFVTELGSTQGKDPNKIYILETTEDGQIVYKQYKIKDKQWVFIGYLGATVNLEGYLKSADAERLYQHKGSYLTQENLSPYALNATVQEISLGLRNYARVEYVSDSIQQCKNYVDNYLEAYKEYIDSAFVKKSQVYTIEEGSSTADDDEPIGTGSGSGTGGGGTVISVSTIEIDKSLSFVSPNPVENRVITEALSTKVTQSQLDNYATLVQLAAKVDRSQLIDYVTNDNLQTYLYSKQDKLIAGNGIQIENNIISTNLQVDTNIYEFITELGSTYGMDPNKIYILETKVDGQYIYKQYKIKDGQWVLLGDVTPSINLNGYLKKNDADLLYQPKGSYVTEDVLSSYAPATSISDLRLDLLEYAKTEYVSNSLQQYETYMENYLQAYKDYIDETFVKKVQVYTINEGGEPVEDDEWTPGSGNHGGGGSSVIIQPSTIQVDHDLSFVSPNPVENRAVAEALSTKATKQQLESYATLIQLAAKVDKVQLVNYVTNDNLQSSLYNKQDRLTAGKGIKIANNVISTDIDTSVFVIVDELPDDIDQNKIYLLREVQNVSWGFGDKLPLVYAESQTSEERYTQYKWDSDNYQWINIGSITPDIDLSNYISRDEASLLFASSGSYATTEQLQQTVECLEDIYQPKGDYLVPDDISELATIQELQQETARSEDTYVKKVQVYTEDNGVDGPNNPTIDPDDVGIISRGVVNTVFLTKRQYQALVNMNYVKEDVYYFTYEGDDELESWAFGGTFPITLI